MSNVAELTSSWAVLAHSRGEVLTAQARSPGLHLGLLGVPPGFDARDAEGWLYDVVGVAHETHGPAGDAQSIPMLLRHALTGLLFSHAELWEQAGEPRPCSFAFADAVHEVGFGVVGEAEVALWVDGERREPDWVSVRDALGREARAWSCPAGHGVRVRMLWHRSAADPQAGAAHVEAVWAGTRSHVDPSGPDVVPPVMEDLGGVADERIAAAEGEFEHVAGAAAAAEMALAAGIGSAATTESGVGAAPARAETTPEVGALAHAAEETEATAPVEGSAIARWLRRGFSWFSAQGAGGSPETEPEAETGEPAGGALEPGRDQGSAGEGPNEDRSPALTELIPPSPESIDVTKSTAPVLPPSAPRTWHGPAVPIPPSPEPAELTERTVAWPEPGDPHAIALPPGTAAAPSGPAPPPGYDPAPAPGASSPPAGSLPADTPASEARLETATAPPLVLPYGPGLAIAFLAERTPAPAASPAPEVAPTPSKLEHFYTVPPQRPAWPSAEELAHVEPRVWQRPWMWLGLIAVLLAGGWLVGTMQVGGRPRADSRPGALGGALRALGLGGPRFTVDVRSRPPGAWIAVDGKASTLRTPAAVDVAPGEHTIALSFPDLGVASYTVRGSKGDRVPLEATLWGALEIYSPNEVGLIAVAVDGVARGAAPLRVDSLTPGVHEVRFSGPGMTPWGQTVDIRVGETRDLLARAVQSPATGVLQVQASQTDEQGTQPLKGAQVWIDGEARGTTPLTLDLSRGPHSVRLVYKGQEAPIQDIDLPGGNQRFAVFELGLDQEAPRLASNLAARLPRDRPALVSAWLAGLGTIEVREMWLHAQMGEGAWRRYPMSLLKAPTGSVGVAVFPAAAFDRQGRARYYLSAHHGQGDESFTEIRTVQLEAGAGR